MTGLVGGLVALVVLRGPPGWVGRLAGGLGLAGLPGAAVWGALQRPEAEMLGALSWSEIAARASPGMIAAGIGALVERVPWGAVAAVAAVVGVGLVVRRREGAALWAVAVAAGAGVVWPRIAPPPPPEGPAAVAMVLGLDRPGGAGEARTRVEGEGPGVPSRPPRVALVMVESASGVEVDARLREAPDSPFARFAARGRLFSDVVAPANASHMGQPALLNGHDFSPGLAWAPALDQVPKVRWSFPTLFHALGARPLMVSSQDEGWLGMRRLTLDLPWERATHSHDDRDPDHGYRDGSGVWKLYDDVTLAGADEQLRAVGGGLFLYVVLQDTHAAYIPPGGPAPEMAPGVFLDMPAEEGVATFARYRAALAHTLDRVAALAERHPDVLWILTGDHGEAMEVGPGFAHAKLARTEEAGTFALFVGPGVEPGRDAGLRSTVDLLGMAVAAVGVEVPAELLADVPRWDTPAPATFIHSSGLREMSVAAVDERLELLASASGERCRDRSDGSEVEVERCARLGVALRAWLACKHATGRGVGAAPDACFAHGREVYATAER